MGHGDLTPYQKQNSYYRGVQLGKDVRKQSEIINNSTRELIATQIASTNAIIASQERIAEGIDVVACGIGRVEEGIYELKAAFEWGIAEVVWQLEQNREVLKSIEEGIWSPFDAQARNRKRQAQEAYEYGWIDEAEEYYLESEKIVKTDFSVHISLGLIYLFHKIDKDKSFSYFEKAVKYAKPKSAYHTSYALIHKALIKFDIGEVSEAEKYSAEAIDFSADFVEAIYQNSQYNAQLKNEDKAISNLEKAIRADKLYCLKAHSDPMFDPIRKSVIKLFEKLRDEEKKNALEAFERLLKKHNASIPIITDISKEKFIDASSWKTKSEKLSTELNILSSRINRNSYFDFLEINNNITSKIQKYQDDLISDLKQKIRTSFENISHGIENAKSVHKNKIQDYLGTTGSAILIGSFIVPFIMTILTEDGWSKLGAVVFLIPVFSQLVSIVMLFLFVSNYSSLPTNELIFGWALVLYLLGSIAYYFIAKSSSKGEMNSEISNQNSLKKAALPYVERIKKL